MPSVRAVEINYGYDDLNRLVSATRSDGPALAFQYDEAGNFTSQGVSNSPDTDGDLIANFADPDDDGDGITNLAEYQGNTDPLQNQQNSGTAHASVPAVPAEGLLLMAVALWRIAARLNQKNRGL
ncbi:RHS repeat domain-containing protein [Methylocaldum sp. RMAD-M]|uniref:RHS repeat domain-containing protein n=1 Tax=Methylocaldum sp. RMAD-M TaxID=2806557 RepID=UPI00143DA98E|nr:RHS repeat domain-containing protein [Methylocaldum sp. RMAD-M]MBP1149516.1 YD repeat-containing protein [Methylocaldum sp. RMAD-M]